MSANTPLYDKMLIATEDAHWRALDDAEVLSPAERLFAYARIARNLEPERQAAEIRLRAERNFSVLLRDAAGLQPKSKRDAAWLAAFEAGVERGKGSSCA